MTTTYREDQEVPISDAALGVCVDFTLRSDNTSGLWPEFVPDTELLFLIAGLIDGPGKHAQGCVGGW